MSKRKTTLKQDQEIIKMYLDGERNRDIGKKFNIDRHTVIAIIKRNNIQTKLTLVFNNPKLQKEIEDLYTNGKHILEIAKVLKIGKNTVISALDRKNLRSIKNNKRFLIEEIDFIRQNYPLFGSSFCAEKLNRTIKSVSGKVKRLKLKRIYITKEGLKPCQTCFKLKPVEDFFKLERVIKTGRFSSCKSCRNVYVKNRRIDDINYRLRCQFAGRILSAIKSQNGTKSAKTLELLGCSIRHARKHIESQFTPNMNWDNQGRNGWELDHIIPIKEFDLTKLEDQHKCFHYTNLRPLWATTDIAIKMGDAGMVGNVNRNASQYKDNPYDISIRYAQ